MSKLTVYVAKSQHPSLIGRFGATIKQIQTDSGANVQLPPRDKQTDAIVLAGTEEQIELAVQAINKALGYEISKAPLLKKEIKIDPGRYGALIGRGGSTLRQLERDNGVAIVVPRRDSKTDLVTVSGSEAACRKCLAAVAKLLGNTKLAFVGEEPAGGADDDDDDAEVNVKVELHEEHAAKDERPVTDKVRAFVWGKRPKEFWQHFYVPKRFHGALVGRGGSVIKKLERDSSTKIRVPRRDDDDMSIRVYGTVAQLEKAQDCMEAILGFEPQPAPATKSMLHEKTDKSAAPAVVDMNNMKRFYVPHSCFFELIGHNGHTVKGIEQREGVKIRIPHKGDKDTAVRVYGSDAAIEEARGEMEEVLGFAPSTVPIKAHLIVVPDDAHNKLIGEGGATLKRLEDQSDCNIVIPKKSAKDQRILLEGNEDAIAKAAKLIGELIGQELKYTETDEAEAMKVADDRTCDENDARQAPQPTREELKSLTKASEKLWELDHDRLTIARDVFINVQRAVAVYHTGDRSNEEFFDHIERDVFLKPTFRCFFALLDNYETVTGKREVVTAEERRENWNFINACCLTPVMRYAHAWCVGRGLVPKDEATWKKMLYNAWFALYRRGTHNDSCGFEHVFVGEVKNDSVTGFHNWLQFYREEKAKKVDYRGYVVNHRRGRPTNSAEGNEKVLSIKFAWGNEEKPVSTFVLGSTPEYELALYSMAFFNRDEKTKVFIDNVPVELTCYRIRSRYGDKIGTAFPSAKN